MTSRTQRWRDRLAVALYVGGALYVWVAYPRVMAGLLLVGMVAVLFVASVLSVATRAKRKRF